MEEGGRDGGEMEEGKLRGWMRVGDGGMEEGR